MTAPNVSEDNDDCPIRQAIASSRPSAFGKIGGTEGKAILFANKHIWKWIKRSRYNRNRNELFHLSGVFPNTSGIFDRFIHFYTRDVLPNVDALAHWRGHHDTKAARKYAPGARCIPFVDLEFPGIRSSDSWHTELSGKQILAVSSLTNTIERQLPKLGAVWPDHPWLHNQDNTQLVRCPMYAHLEKPVDSDWFSALRRMSDEISKLEFDVCLIGAGAWSLPLAVEVKKMGKIGIHMGGALQLLYGIKGNRWIKEEPNHQYFNQHWVYPCAEDTPKTFDRTEDAAYWQGAR